MKKLCRRMEGELLGFDAQKQFVFFGTGKTKGTLV